MLWLGTFFTEVITTSLFCYTQKRGANQNQQKKRSKVRVHLCLELLAMVGWRISIKCLSAIEMMVFHHLCGGWGFFCLWWVFFPPPYPIILLHKGRRLLLDKMCQAPLYSSVILLCCWARGVLVVGSMCASVCHWGREKLLPFALVIKIFVWILF